MMDPKKIGIYLNKKDGKLLRITSPYYIPKGADWTMVSSDPNETLVSLREIIKKKKLLKEPEKAAWGRLPLEK